MQIETMTQDTQGTYWYVANHCSWINKTGDVSAKNRWPIEVEVFITAAEAGNLPGNPQDGRYLNKQTILRLCFGSKERQNSVKIALHRSFFQQAVQNKVIPRADRTGKWLTLSIIRNEAGIPIGLNVRTKGKDTPVPTTEYGIDAGTTPPDWRHANFIAVECWGKSDDNFQFNLGRISLGKIEYQSSETNS